MANETDLAELTKVPEAIRRLQDSSRRALPITLIGLAATLIAAAISTYYAFYLSAQLAEARAELTQTKTELRSIMINLGAAKSSLNQVRAYVAPSKRHEVDAALGNVTSGERQLSTASATLAKATSRLPASKAASVTAPSSQWFAVIGSYPVNEAGLREARQKAAEVMRQGQCTEVWQTVVSNNYAVVLDGALDEASARKAAADARTSGIASDAFAQPDRNWRVVIRFPTCAS